MECSLDSLEAYLVQSMLNENHEMEEYEKELEATLFLLTSKLSNEALVISTTRPIPSIEQALNVELKALPSHLC